jgi:chromosome segregation ATPase
MQAALELSEAARSRFTVCESSADDTKRLSDELTRNSDLAQIEISSRKIALGELEEQLRLIHTDHMDLLDGESIDDLRASVDQFRGRVRALEFVLPILKEEQWELKQTLDTERNEVPRLRAELASLLKEKNKLHSTKIDFETKLKFLRDRVKLPYPSFSELETLVSRNECAQYELDDLRKSLDTIHRSIEESRGAGGLELARWELGYKKKDLLTEIRKLERKQAGVCEWLMSRLSFSIEREELRMRVRALHRELILMRDDIKIFSIPENIPVLTSLEYEGSDIDARQEDLVHLHQDLREATRIHQGLQERISILERELT